MRTRLSREKEMTDLAANVFQVRTSTKKAPVSRSRRAPSARVKRVSKGNGNEFCGRISETESKGAVLTQLLNGMARGLAGWMM